ncbi:unnamed protein product [Vicia faba]|uniref:Uncharacterized protein n=1 Tax=Vicia faba TaxID=3906 RepID=A0AAV1A7B9_VICFA|nr:unnamed protein product [Vicia faba]
MALSLGKITILLGAGLAGSAIAKKEGLFPDVFGLVSGTFKPSEGNRISNKGKSIIFVNPSGSGRNHYEGTESEMTFSGRNPELPGCTSLKLSENHLWQVPTLMERHLVAGDELKNPNQQISYKL